GEGTLRRAIVDGVDPSGARLHPAMPRFQMPPARTAELVAYLTRIGDEGDADPGVTEGGGRVGALLPLPRPAASMGRGVRAMLSAVFESVNAGGGVYGRRLELVVGDAAAGGTAPSIDRGRVFALVGSMEPAGGALDGVPLVGPLALSPHGRGDD